jgi:hypothetical protein
LEVLNLSAGLESVTDIALKVTVIYTGSMIYARYRLEGIYNLNLIRYAKPSGQLTKFTLTG